MSRVPFPWQRSLLTLAFLCCFTGWAHAQLSISEFLASNSNSIRDEDGDHSDWVEVYNSDPAAVSLAGWYLTDDANQPRKWAFPAQTLNSGAYLVIFASGKDRRSLTTNLHTNFKLNTAPDYLALTHDVAGGGIATVQAFDPYPQQATDVAFGTNVTVTTTALITPGMSAKTLVPTAANGGSTLPYSAWTGGSESFDDTAWTAGTSAIGFPNAGVATANLRLRLNANTAAALVEDISGAAHNGTNNTATWTAETADATARTRHGALLFNATDSNGTGTGDQVVVPAHADFNVASGTIMFWIKTAGNVADGGAVEGAMILDRRVGTGVGQGLVLYLRDDGRLQIQPSAGGTLPNTFASTVAVKDNRWHHAALVFNTTTGQACTFYIDGVVAGTRNNTGPWSFNASQPIEIGRSHNTYWRRFNGVLDDFRFYNTALAPADIQKIVADEDEPVTPGTDLQAAMTNVNASAFVRVPFNVADPTAFTGANLTMRWNDGFVAWLNGVQVGSFGAPATPAYDSAATQTHSAGAPFAIPLAPSSLRAGANILALQVLNNSAANGAFFALPQLDGTNTTSGGASYLTSPTPGAVNSGAKSNLGPFVKDVTRDPSPRPTGALDSPPLVITAKVLPSLRPLAAATPVQLKYRVMFAAEQTATMLDDGVAPDGTAGDGMFTAQLDTTTLKPGQMLRWRVVATDETGVTGTGPEFSDPLDNEQYYGTVAVDPAIASSLPVFYWFLQTAGSADNATGTRCSVFYKAPGDPTPGRFYDNDQVNLHGQSSAGFSKKSYDFNFNEDNRFEWNAAAKKVKDFNLLTNWGDKSKTHNALTHEVAAAVGSGAHWDYHVRVQQVTSGNANNNAAHFFSIADLMEDGGEDWLQRIGRDPQGALYKSYNDLSNSGGLEKKTRKQENKADADALIAGLNPGTPLNTRRAFGYANLDLPQCVSYFVAMALVSSQDHGHKNYYVYRDTRGTGEWSIFPWDTDLTWGRNWTDAQGYFTDTIYTNNPLNMYPGYNDGGSPSSVQNKGAMNRLYTVMFDTPEFRKMYLRRLRTAVDTYFNVPGLLEARVDAMTEAMDPAGISLSDADRDRTRWGTWGTDGGFTVGGDVLRYHTGILKNTYLAGRRAWFNSVNAKLFYTGGNMPVPASEPANPGDLMSIETVDFNPATGTQEHEYFVVRNSNTYDVDISGWSITGAVEWTFKPGTVIPAGGGVTEHIGDLFVAKNPLLFRQGATVPGGRQFCFVQGPYHGQLSARGEALELRDPAGNLIKTKSWTPAPSALQTGLRITEINYAPALPTAAERAALPGVVESDFEYLELMNIGPTELTLTGASFGAGIDFTFAAYTLPSGARCLLVANLAAFQLRYGQGLNAQIAGVYGGNLDNGGENLQLLDATGEMIVEFSYVPEWFPPSNEGGRTLVLRTDGADWSLYDLPTTWALSGQPNGTPGAGDNGDFAHVFEGWRHDHFTPSEQAVVAFAGANADADGDGLTNWPEYVFGRNPRAHDNSSLTLPGTMEDAGEIYATITFIRRHKALDVNWTVEVSSDLRTWAPITQVVGVPQSLNTELERVTYRDSQSIDTGTRFLRVRAVR